MRKLFTVTVEVDDHGSGTIPGPFPESEDDFKDRVRAVLFCYCMEIRAKRICDAAKLAPGQTLDAP